MSSIISSVCGKNVAESRELISAYEEWAKQFPQVDIPVKHYIHGGMYAREITIPKDTYITGQLYKFNHFDVMISGDITVSTDTGERKRLTGYNVFEGLSGKKRAGYAHEDTTWITFHVAEGDNGDDIQKAITVESFEELENFYLELDTISYEHAIKTLGYTEAELQEHAHEEDLVKMPDSFRHVYVDKSKISGNGLYSKIGYEADSVVCLARIQSNRTIAGRYTNHSHSANCYTKVLDNGDVLLVSKRKLLPGEELTINYLETINDRAAKGDLCPE